MRALWIDSAGNVGAGKALLNQPKKPDYLGFSLRVITSGRKQFNVAGCFWPKAAIRGRLLLAG